MSQTIIITGASSGIGAATAKVFLNAGWQVGLIARRQDVLEKVAAGHANAHILVADVTDETALRVAFERFAKAAGRLDVLFNNAGMVGPSGLIDEIPLDQWRATVELNLTGMFLAARFAFGQMRAQSPQGGRIINNGSVSAQSPRPATVAYCSTKHAITGLTKSLSLDGRAFDIACGQIDIGNAQTELLQQLNAKTLAANPAADMPEMMDVAIAADAVLQMASLPSEANVQFMTVMATKMPLVGRG
ncbi:MAG TPA: short-chain dehydrogenase [Rhodobacteraceae bacterium]|jgi:NADP-dependent 3-hydroxy acid dehydrogenase YdfG|nr:short-chain dehydrogenase [Paracoccaceae bacterium]